MNKTPLVTVLMPNYNCENYIKEAVESILGQTYRNIRLIIVDDFSTDNSWERIIKLQKNSKKISIYRNKFNLGRPKTRNLLLSLIPKGSKYFLWMDSDDVVNKNLVKEKVYFLEKNKNIDGVGSSVDYVDKDLNFLKRRIYPQSSEEIKKNMAFENSISQGGLLLRYKLKKEKYDEKYLVCQDYHMWIKLIKKNYRFHNLNTSYYFYRQFPNQGKQKNLKLSIWNTLRIKNEYIFSSEVFSLKVGIRYILEFCALFFPKKLILWLFYKKN